MDENSTPDMNNMTPDMNSGGSNNNQPPRPKKERDPNAPTFSDKFKQFSNKIGKKGWAIIGIVAVVVIGVAVFLSVRKESVVDQAEVKFNGYNGDGVANISNSSEMDKATMEILAKKAGIDLSTLTNPDWSDISSENMSKAKLFSDWATNTKVSFDKSSHLSNGDKVTLSVKTGGDKTNPIAEGSKTFTVSGLKKIAKVSTKKILDKFKVKFIGLNTRGIAMVTSKSITDNLTLTVKDNGKLTNGDTVSIKLPASLFEAEGKKYTGSRTLKVKVSDLEDASKISNLADAEALSLTVMEDMPSYKEATLMGLYLIPSNSSNDYSYYGDSEFDDNTEDVVLNDESDENIEQNEVSLVGIYSARYTFMDPEDEPESARVQINDLKLEDGKLNIDEVDTDESGDRQAESESVKTLQHNYSVKGIQLK